MGLGLFRRFVVRVYDEAGNVIQTHEHAASSKTRFFACTPSHFPPKTICYGAVREANADSPRCERSGAFRHGHDKDGDDGGLFALHA